MPFDLTSVNAKLDRAEEHLGTLEREMLEWIKSEPCELFIEFHGPLDGRIRNRLKRPPPATRWSLIVGDCLHNLRAALDHLVYAIALHQSQRAMTVEEINSLAFIVASTPTSYASEMKRRLGPLHVTTRAEIERVQPYNRPHPTHAPLLGILRELNNTDKHRLIHPVFLFGAGGKFTVWRSNPNRREDISVKFRDTDVPLEDGAEVASITIKHPAPNMAFHAEHGIGVHIRHAPGPQGDRTPLPGLLREFLVPEVRDVVRIVSAAVK